MTDRDARLLTLIAQAVLMMELTMREYIDALKAILAEQTVAIDNLSARVDALKLAADTGSIKDAEAQALTAEIAVIVDGVRANVARINGMAA